MIPGQTLENYLGADALDILFITIIKTAFSYPENPVVGAVKAQGWSAGQMDICQRVCQDGVHQSFQHPGPPALKGAESVAIFVNSRKHEISVSPKGLGNAGDAAFGTAKLAVIIKKGSDDGPGADAHDGIDKNNFIDGTLGPGRAGQKRDGRVTNSNPEKG